MTNVEIDFFPKAEVVTASGRVYPYEVLDKALHDAVANHIPVKLAGSEDDDCMSAGFVRDYDANKNKMVITLSDSWLGKMVAQMVQHDSVVISLAGIGYTDETQKVTEFRPTHGCVCERWMLGKETK